LTEKRLLLKVKLETRLMASFAVFATSTIAVGVLALYHLNRSPGPPRPGLDWLLTSGIIGDARTQIVLACAGAVLLAIVGSFWCAAFITRPITKVSRQILELGEGRLDIQPYGLGRPDEVGDLAKAFVMFEGRLREQQATERRAAEQEERARAEEARRQAAELEEARAQQAHAARLESLVAEFETGVAEVLAALNGSGRDLKQTAQAMSSTVETTHGRAAKVAAASQDADAGSQAIAEAAARLSSSISEIFQQVAASKAISDEAALAAEATDRRMAELAGAAGQVGEIVDMIRDVAFQTNMLALNAAVEATRAGEAGAGFVVIAREVKALADKTALAAAEVAQRIDAMRTETHSAGDTITKVVDTVRRVTAISSTVAEATEAQDRMTREIAERVKQAAAGAREVSVNIESVSAATAQTAQASNDVNLVSDRVLDLARRLGGRVETFLGAVRTADAPAATRAAKVA
jgi:methyl-accepting chemotaxis protein